MDQAKSVTNISLYLTSNKLRSGFLKLNSLEYSVREMIGDIILAGAFNVSAVE